VSRIVDHAGGLRRWRRAPKWPPPNRSGRASRERLLQYGVHTLTDAELVSLLLSAGANTVQVAQRLLEAVGGIPGLARWHPEALCRLPGLGEVTAARLVAALALPQRRTTVNTVTVTGPADLVPVFRPLLAGLPHERLAVAVCDRRTRVRAVRAVADGTTDACLLPVRDIVTTVLRHDGHAFGIAHNHPVAIPPRAGTTATPPRTVKPPPRPPVLTALLEVQVHATIRYASTPQEPPHPLPRRGQSPSQHHCVRRRRPDRPDHPARRDGHTRTARGRRVTGSAARLRIEDNRVKGCRSKGKRSQVSNPICRVMTKNVISLCS
jgi:DNA repair protein RadC